VKHNNKFFRCRGNNIITVVTEKKDSGVVSETFLITMVIILLQPIQIHESINEH
jgi:hypothetical protein